MNPTSQISANVIARALLAVITAFFAANTQAQNINYEMHDIAFYRLPLKPLDSNAKTYSVSLEDLNRCLEHRPRDSKAYLNNVLT